MGENGRSLQRLKNKIWVRIASSWGIFVLLDGAVLSKGLIEALAARKLRAFVEQLPEPTLLLWWLPSLRLIMFPLTLEIWCRCLSIVWETAIARSRTDVATQVYSQKHLARSFDACSASVFFQFCGLGNCAIVKNLTPWSSAGRLVLDQTQRIRKAASSNQPRKGRPE